MFKELERFKRQSGPTSPNPTTSGKSTPTTSSSGRSSVKRKNPRKQYRNRKFCLTCLTDFKSKQYALNDVCLNPLYNVSESELRYLNMCPETSAFCQIEVYTVNGIFSGLERRCATICVPVCFQRFVFVNFVTYLNFINLN